MTDPTGRSLTLQESIPQPVLSPDQKYAPVPGRQIFEELSITGLNRAPIETLTAFITADSEMNPKGATMWPEVPLADVCQHLLVDGSFAMRYTGEEKADQPYLFLRDCLEIHRFKIVQRLRDEADHLSNIMRVYERGEKNWTVSDVRGAGSQSPQTIRSETYALDLVIAWPYGKGLLWWNQKTFRRLEEIQESIRANTGPAALSLIVTGYTGDWKRAQDTFTSGAKVIGIPGKADVHRVAANNTTSDLLQNEGQLLPTYLENMHLFKASETLAISGKSRIIAMKPMLNYVTTIRTVLDKVYALLKYETTWGGLDVTDTSEKVAELDFLKRGYDERILSEEEYRQKSRALYGLTDKPERDIEQSDTGDTTT